MQVSQLAELDTHAVIGGAKPQAFGMAQTAEFFTVLSDTLYRDKKLAVIRETVCNAWDAHIKVGKTDLPIDITITEEEMVIKDFGPGIPHDKIGPVYCVYGASTKVHSDDETGGFGLGSKAPFAYSDHFTVTNCHAGVRGLYAISRGGAATEGVPDFRCMVSVPTTETGVTVSIPLKDARDIAEFTKLIRAVVRRGGMKARLTTPKFSTSWNSRIVIEPESMTTDVIEGFDYTALKAQGFGILNERDDLRESPVYVLYGTVLYPLTTTDKLLSQKVSALEHLVESGVVTVLYAPPGSIGIVPSREALSYSEKTIENLGASLERASNMLKVQREPLIKELVKERVAKMKRLALTPDLDNARNEGFVGALTDPVEITRRKLRATLSSQVGYKVGAVARACVALHRDSRRAFRRMPVDKGHGFFEREAHKHTMKPILRLLSRTSMLPEALALVESEYRDRLVPLTEAKIKTRLVEPVLFIGPSMKAILAAIEAYAKDNPGERLTRNSWSIHRTFTAIVMKKKDDAKLAEIGTEATKLKIGVVALEWPVRKKPVKAVKPIDTYAPIDSVTWSKSVHTAKMPTTFEKPCAYVRVGGTPDALFRVPSWIQEQGSLVRHVKETYPGVVLAIGSKQEAKLKMMGVKSLDEVVIEELEKLGDSRDVQYARMISGKHFISGTSGRFHLSNVQTAENLAQRDMRIAKMLFPDKVKLTPKVERASTVFSIASELVNYVKEEERRDRFQKARKVLTTAAKATFKDQIITPEVAEKQFSYLKILAGVEWLDIKISVEELLDTVRFLQRRHDKSKLTDTTATATEPMKEAA